ncbi:MAG: hypothetical protein APF84_13270 [Gracilibacter sp. BRH_c7a]|nr:MAG: hypothetical protein APF84_13270 [Gracilibacter sp. BRH_c7a]
MQVDYPYMISNNKIGPILESIKHAAKPNKFTHQLLKQMGFASSNDRAIIPLLKRLDFLTEDGTPTEFYSRLKDPTDHAYVLGEKIREAYSELYSINTNIHKLSDDEIKGAFSRITGKDEKTVNRYFATFKTLVGIAKFDNKILHIEQPEKSVPETNNEKETKRETPKKPLESQFHYNIQIHLPATTDISVYNAIFKSLKENLNL